MPKAFINVTVEAENEDRARATADAWVDWLSPTLQQALNYMSDHDDLTIIAPGVFAIDGDSEVEEVDDD